MKTTDPSASLKEACAVPDSGGVRELAAPLARPQRGRLIAAIAFLVLLVALFSRHLAALGSYAAGNDLNSHILLVPFVSAYLIAIQRRQLPAEYSTAPILGALATLLGLASFGIAHGTPALARGYSQNDFLALIAVSFVCFVAAGAFLFLGRKWMSAAVFPVGFLLFLAPLPDAAVFWLETASKYASADAADLFFNLTGTPVLRDGLFMQLPGITLEVAQECSGIRSSWVLFITSLVASYLFLRSPWHRSVLVLFVFPLAILRNGFRILVIGLMCVHIGPEMINSVVHRRGGPAFFALSLIPLFGLLWWLRRRESNVGRRTSKS